MSDKRVFNQAELRTYDGSKGNPVYIAYSGVVYDVTASSLWRTGMHQDLHYAGIDLTRSLRKAPHDARVLARSWIRIVGTLNDA